MKFLVRVPCLVILGGVFSARAWAGGTVTGRVLHEGPRQARSMPITKDNAICGTGYREIVDVDVAEGLLRDAVIYVDGEVTGGSPPVRDHAELMQEDCRFKPTIMTAQLGEELHIVNGDRIGHNIHAYEMLGKARKDFFNFDQPFEGHRRQMPLDTRHTDTIELACDIHDFMSGWIFLTPNAFATVATDGTWTIEGLPAGTYTLKVFHPVLGTSAQQVTVPAEGSVTADFSL
ncbi:MAG: carboxypeptidase regulatory-like domain-containing protein [Myxococcota bacterium]|nr:carboxypeptidase regulatory-like domain-containing protein [Myxococcota bacterium]